MALADSGRLWLPLVGFGWLRGRIVNGPRLGHSRLSHLMEMHVRITSGPKRRLSDKPHMGDSLLLLHHMGELYISNYLRLCYFTGALVLLKQTGIELRKHRVKTEGD